MTKEQKVYRLEDLDVNEVSHVDRGANKRTYLMVKNAEDNDMPQPKTPEAAPAAETPAPSVEKTDEVPATEAPATEPEAKPDAVVAAQAEKAGEDTALMTALPASVRESMGAMLTDLSKRIGALGDAIKAAPEGEGTVTDKFKNELLSTSVALRQLIGAEKAADIEGIEKGVLTMGVPMAGPMQMSGESMVVQTAEGPMVKMPLEMMKGMACKYAMDKLYDAEDMLYDSDLDGCCICIITALKSLTPFVSGETAMPADVQMAYKAMKQYAFNQPQPSIAAGVPDAKKPDGEPPEGMGVQDGNLAKAGRKISGANLDKLSSMATELEALLADLRPAVEEAKVTKADDQVATLRGQLASVVALAKQQQKQLNTLRSSRPLGNSSGPVEGSTEVTKSPEPSWPDDLTDLLKNDPDQ